MKKIFVFLVMFVSVPFLQAFIWPVEDFRVNYFFMENLDGHFNRGIWIATESPVACSEDGQLIFYENRNSVINFPASALGGLSVLQHEPGMFSVYGNLLENTIVDKSEIKTGEIIGEAARNSDGETVFSFSVIDEVLGGFVNPLLVLPPRPDNFSPIIRGLYLVSPGNEISFGPNEYIPVGKYTCYVNSYDLVGADLPAEISIPFSIQIDLNGTTVFDVKMDVLRELYQKIDIGFSNPFPLKDLFDQNGRIKGPEVEILDGRNSFVLRLGDKAGNVTVWRFALNGL